MRLLVVASTLLAGITGLLCSCGGEEATPETETEELTYETHAKEMVQWWWDYAAVLDSCASEASARAAVPKLQALLERIEAWFAQEEELRPSREGPPYYGLRDMHAFAFVSCFRANHGVRQRAKVMALIGSLIERIDSLSEAAAKCVCPPDVEQFFRR